MRKYFAKATGLSVVLVVTATLGGGSSSCTPGVVGSAAKAPGIPGGECDGKALGGVVSPLVLEWPAGARSDLEAAAHDGVVVVSFTCDAVKVLADCKVKGDYGYRAVTPRLETTLIEGKDDIKASFGGGAWALGGDMQRDAKLDLTTMLVGKLSTARANVYRGDLEGDEFCKGATHFVKRIDLGAFALATGANVTAGFSAKAFGQGTSGNSSSKDVRTKSDGEPAACKVSNSADAKAPEGCAAPIRVSLGPIRDGVPSKGESLSAKGSPDGVGCPAPFKYVEGACVAHAPEGKGVLCDEGDEAGCQEQCKKGSHGSCDRFAKVVIYGGGDDKDASAVAGKVKALAPQIEAACKADQATACTALGFLNFFAAMSAKPPSNAQLATAIDYLQLACVAGEFSGCALLKGFSTDPDIGSELGKDLKSMFAKATQRGCDAGNAIPCGFLAFELARSPKSAKKASELADKACQGSFPEACLLRAGLHADTARCDKLWTAANPKLQRLYTAEDLCVSAGPDATLSKTSEARACALGACVK